MERNGTARTARSVTEQLERSLCCHEQLVLLLVMERVAESDLGQRSTATRVMNDLRHHSFQVPVALAESRLRNLAGPLRWWVWEIVAT